MSPRILVYVRGGGLECINQQSGTPVHYALVCVQEYTRMLLASENKSQNNLFSESRVKVFKQGMETLQDSIIACVKGQGDSPNSIQFDNKSHHSYRVTEIVSLKQLLDTNVWRYILWGDFSWIALTFPCFGYMSDI